MAAPRATPLVADALRGTIYDFVAAGDTLPMHEHDAATDHMTVVARGAFLGRGQGWGDTPFAAGDVLPDLPSPHEFEATQANSRLVNIIKAAAKE